LRSLLDECGLEEGFKWGWPCYMQDGANIVLMHGFKEYCALLLFKGALLDDADGLLVQQTENVQSARQIRFTSVAQIQQQSAAILRYVRAAGGGKSRPVRAAQIHRAIRYAGRVRQPSG
jgi:uncharacterized protein YdeI (YjbR/CyaY-like superfamily)